MSDNRCHYEGNGGGIFNRGTLVLVGTTVADNTADVRWRHLELEVPPRCGAAPFPGIRSGPDDITAAGGGIGNVGKLTLVNSTVSNNEAAALWRRHVSVAVAAR